MSDRHELALKKTPSVEKLTLYKAQVLECTLCASVQGPLPSAAAVVAVGSPSIQMYVYTYHSYAQSPVVDAADTRIWTPERSRPRDDGALCNGAPHEIIGART